MRNFGRLVLAGGVALSSMLAAATWRDDLPRPVFDEKPELVDFYFKAWELAHNRIDELPGMPAPRYMDEAYRSDRIWIWDTCFMVHFCKYCPKEFPGIESLENFYAVLLAGENVRLPKVIGNRYCGKDCGKLIDLKIHHPDNPPLFAWTEYVYALQTGDRARLEKVFRDKRWLQRWYDLFDSFDPAKPKPHGAYMPVTAKKTDDGYRWGGYSSGMDNTPRGRKGAHDVGDPRTCPNNPDLLWVDAVAQQGLSALYMSRIAWLLGLSDESVTWRRRYEETKAKVNALYWDESDGCYYDVFGTDRTKCKVMTIASYWPLLAEMADGDRARRQMDRLSDEKTMGGVVPCVSLSRSDADFKPYGAYWRGSVWLPGAYMAIKAVDGAGDYALARACARKVLLHMLKTYETYTPHSIWECYSPTEPRPSRRLKDVSEGDCENLVDVAPDFCGWSALGPISLFIEDVIGVKQADAFANTLTCDFEKNPRGRVGVENYSFGKVTCSVLVTAADITVNANLPFTLKADGRTFAVRPGCNVWHRQSGMENRKGDNS